MSDGVLNGLDLFSGVGGITYALKDYVRPVAYCEKDEYAQRVLLSRMADGGLPLAPIWDDIKTFSGKQYKNRVDIIYGGFPCQNISIAGNGDGLAGQHSGLFFEVLRLLDEIQPSFVFLENVPAIVFRGLGEITSEITQRGYDSRWTVISAAEVGAPHIRKRWWLLAHNNSKRELQSQGCEQKQWRRSSDCHWWAAEPTMGRVVYGLPGGVDRIKCLGNAVVPQQARMAFEVLMGIRK